MARPSHGPNRPSAGRLEVVKEDTETDGFDWDTPEYNINRFYVGATDGKGVTSSPIQVPIAPSLYTEIDRWLFQHRFPDYRNRADFLRDALRHRLEYLNKQQKDPQMQAALALYTREAERAHIRTESDENHRWTQRVEDDCRAYVEREDWPSLYETLEAIADHAEDIPEPWLGRALEVARQYRAILDTKDW